MIDDLMENPFRTVTFAMPDPPPVEEPEDDDEEEPPPST
jgi:hypothetical protein